MADRQKPLNTLHRRQVMATLQRFIQCIFVLGLMLTGPGGRAQPAPVPGVWVAKNFTFHDGRTLPEVKLAYTTLGDPKNPAIVVLHGTNGSGTGMLGKAFGGELFGPGQAMDASRYFIVLPDGLGAGRSSKPSDGLAANFPEYNYRDMVTATHLLLTQGLGLTHVRMVLGNSMGGMHTWMMGIMYPDFADILVPMASMPIAMSGRNWMTRRLIIDSIRNDPDYQGGFYKTQPKSAQYANTMYAVATNGGANGLQKAAPNRQAADQWLDRALKAPFTADANDTLYQWNASRDFAPEPDLEKIKATVLMINSADDERNPPELLQAQRALPRIKNLSVFIIPGSEETSGHGTTGQARWWAEKVRDLLQSAPRM
jgi:homoserine O-acetyltransferase